jgi:hypothetical protein
MFQRLPQAAIESSLCWSFSQNIAFRVFCRMQVGAISEERQINVSYLGSIIYEQVVECGGQDRTGPSSLSVGVDMSPSTKTPNFRCERKNKLD